MLRNWKKILGKYSEIIKIFRASFEVSFENFWRDSEKQLLEFSKNIRKCLRFLESTRRSSGILIKSWKNLQENYEEI